MGPSFGPASAPMSSGRSRLRAHALAVPLATHSTELATRRWYAGWANVVPRSPGCTVTIGLEPELLAHATRSDVRTPGSQEGAAASPTSTCS